MQDAVQTSLLPEPQDLVRQAMKKIAAAGILDAPELEALKRAVKGELVPKARGVDGWQSIMDCWLATYQERTGFKCPRLTQPEAQALKNIAKRCGSAKATIELIKAFWWWRETVEWDVQPTPFGLQKQLQRVQEWVGRKKRERAEQKRQDELRKPKVTHPVNAAQVRELADALARPKDFNAKLRREDEKQRQRLAESCREMAEQL